MAKVDKSKFTKEEWKIVKARRRLEKIASQNKPIPNNDEKYYVLCLKHGDKYSYDYVNRLYNMVERHCTLDYEFVCLTDNSEGLNENITVIDIPKGLEGWWCKVYMYSKDLPIKGTILYMDLDVVIADNIDRLFTYRNPEWCVIRDFSRVMRPSWQKYNSSVIRFQTGQLNDVWERFLRDQKKIQSRLFGDQDWLYEATFTKNPATFWPDSWILSWKWEVRKTKEFAPGGLRGNRTLKTIEDVVPRKECCICVFHGDPNPHRCKDPWVVQNWK